MQLSAACHLPGQLMKHASTAPPAAGKAHRVVPLLTTPQSPTGPVHHFVKETTAEF